MKCKEKIQLGKKKEWTEGQRMKIWTEEKKKLGRKKLGNKEETKNQIKNRKNKKKKLKCQEVKEERRIRKNASFLLRLLFL